MSSNKQVVELIVNEGGKIKMKIVWNIETRFKGKELIINCLTIEFQWSWRLENWMVFISPWRWRIVVVGNGTNMTQKKK